MIWNVQRTVVELIEADSAEEAVNELDEGLTRAGFEPFDGTASSDLAAAFASEDQSDAAHEQARQFSSTVLYGPKRR